MPHCYETEIDSPGPRRTCYRLLPGSGSEMSERYLEKKALLKMNQVRREEKPRKPEVHPGKNDSHNDYDHSLSPALEREQVPLSRILVLWT